MAKPSALHPSSLPVVGDFNWRPAYSALDVDGLELQILSLFPDMAGCSAPALLSKVTGFV